MESRSDRVFPGTWEDSKMNQVLPSPGWSDDKQKVRKRLWALGSKLQRKKTRVARIWNFKVCGWDVCPKMRDNPEDTAKGSRGLGRCRDPGAGTSQAYLWDSKRVQ